MRRPEGGERELCDSPGQGFGQRDQGVQTPAWGTGQQWGQEGWSRLNQGRGRGEARSQGEITLGGLTSHCGNLGFYSEGDEKLP